MIYRNCLLLLLILITGSFAGLHAQKGSDPSSITFLLENDYFGFSDRHYTSGLRLSWLSSDYTPDQVPAFWRKIDQAIPFWRDLDTPAKNFGFAIGQHIYTPENLNTAQILKDEHPYAGWLYLEGALHKKSQNHLNSLQLSVGVIGPASLGEPTQKLIHSFLDSTPPKGWHNQLKNEPTLLLTYEHHRRICLYQKPLCFDAIPYSQINIGNVRTDLAIGAILRGGLWLPHDFGPHTITLNSYNHNSLHLKDGQEKRQTLCLYGFVGVTARLIARNIFLDGNTFVDSHRVHKIPYTGELRFGFVFLWHNIELSYTQTIKSYEFYGQRYGNDWYGSISVSVSL